MASSCKLSTLSDHKSSNIITLTQSFKPAMALSDEMQVDSEPQETSGALNVKDGQSITFQIANKARLTTLKTSFRIWILST